MRILIWLHLVSAEATRGLGRNRMRSLLTVLGITIGIAAVVSVVAVGDAGSERALDLLRNLGDNLVWVEAGSRNVAGVRTGTKGTSSLTIDDERAIFSEVPWIKSVSPQVDGSILAAAGNRTWTTHYRGVAPEYVDIKQWPLLLGNDFVESDVENATNVCILGRTVREQLFGAESPIGADLRLNGRLICVVIGVLTPKGQSGTGQDQDDTILVPWTMAQRKIKGVGALGLDDIMCSATSMEEVDKAVAGIVALLRERHHIAPGQEDDFNIRRPDEVIKAQIETSRTLATLLVTIAAISLLIGGIGIMNVMLVSVAERTREIGVRRAVGARAGDVQIQFLGEAILLSLFGGLMGVLVGLASSVLIGRALDWPIAIPMQAIVVAPAFAASIGVIFGFYPAWRASRLDPIEALRSE